MTIALADAPDTKTPDGGGLVVAVQTPARARAAGFERVYEDHYRDVYRYVLGLTRSGADAEDITADTFERALRRWSVVPERPLPWLLLVARRLATDRWRRARRLATILATGRRTGPPTNDAADLEFDGWFATLAAVLTPRQREALVLRYQRDLTDAEIGTIMGLSESGLRSLVARALAILRSHPELL